MMISVDVNKGWMMTRQEWIMYGHNHRPNDMEASVG